MAFGDDSDLDGEDVSEDIDQFAERLSNPGIALKAILALAIVNALIWALAIIYPNWLRSFLNPFSSTDEAFNPLPTLIPFITGAALAFSTVRYVRPLAGGYQHAPSEEPDPVANYSETESRQKIWFIAAGAGILNLVALLVVSSRLG